MIMIYTDGTHLVGTNPEELHAFAESIGLKRSWFQEHERHPHYDTLTGSMKHKALAAGAVLIPRQNIILMFELIRERDRIIREIDRIENGNEHSPLWKRVDEINYKLNNLYAVPRFDKRQVLL